MADLFNFHLQRFPEKADALHVDSNSVALLDDDELSPQLKRVKTAGDNCEIETALNGARGIAQRSLNSLDNLDQQVAIVEKAQKEKAEATVEQKRAKLHDLLDKAEQEVDGLHQKVKGLDPQKDQTKIAQLKAKIATLESDMATLRKRIAAIKPKLAPKTKRHRTLDAIKLMVNAAPAFGDVCSPAGKRAALNFLAANKPEIEAVFDGSAIKWAQEFFSETLISLSILKRSTDPALPDSRLLIKTSHAMLAALNELQWVGSLAEMKLGAACSVMHRPVRMPGWVRNIDSCCSNHEGPTDDDGRLLDSYPFEKMERVKQYKRDLAKAEKCKESKANPATPPAAPTIEGEGTPHGHDCEADCQCHCDDFCMPQNPCCIELNSYVTDLMTVRQTPLCYEAGDLAHIQNVMQGEKITRTHESLKETEEYSETETTRSSSEEHNHETAERFELQEAAQKTIQQDFAADAGVTVSAKYGAPSSQVAVTASANVSYANSKSEAKQTAKNYAKDVTQRSILKVQEETRSLSSRRMLRRITETNTHSFEGADSHVIGQYYYVNKVSEAQVINWGKRMMYEFVVPEPAALYKELMMRREKAAKKREAAIPLPDFDIDYEFISPFSKDENGTVNENYYLDLLSPYGIADAPPPPKPIISHPFGYAHTGESIDADGLSFVIDNSIVVPDGYTAYSLSADGRAANTHETDNNITLSVAGKFLVVHNRGASIHDLAVHEGQTLKIIGFAKGVGGTKITGQVNFELNEGEMDKWKKSIFDLIQGAINSQAIAADLEAEPLVQIKGRNPFLNRQKEKDELKRIVISMISCQHFDRFGAMLSRVEPCGHPQLDFPRAQEEGAFIQFFEQAFEWDQMMYLFYPYFWGKKCGWEETIETNSGDALFDKFLSAGAARVQGPVRPGFEKQMLHYEQTGEIWLGNGEPDYDDTKPHYVAMHTEFRNQGGNFQQDRSGLVDVEFDYNDETGSPLTAGDDMVMIKGIDSYWDWSGPSDPSYPNDVGGVDYTAISEDIDREIIIARKSYRIVSIDIYRGIDGGVPSNVPNDPTQQGDALFLAGIKWIITLDRPVELRDDDSKTNIKYAVGGIFVGASWEITTPTNLVWLRPASDGSYSNCLPSSLPVEC